MTLENLLDTRFDKRYVLRADLFLGKDVLEPGYLLREHVHRRVVEKLSEVLKAIEGEDSEMFSQLGVEFTLTARIVPFVPPQENPI